MTLVVEVVVVIGVVMKRRNGSAACHDLLDDCCGPSFLVVKLVGSASKYLTCATNFKSPTCVTLITYDKHTWEKYVPCVSCQVRLTIKKGYITKQLTTVPYIGLLVVAAAQISEEYTQAFKATGENRKE